MSEGQLSARETRVKRLYMRSIRRGIKEMDLILKTYADLRLSDLDDAALDDYERLLEESDHDLYAWVSGQSTPDAEHAALINDIAQTVKGRLRP